MTDSASLPSVPHLWNTPVETQFFAPDGSNREVLRRMGYAFVDLITDGVLGAQQTAFVAEESPFVMDVPEVGIGLGDLLAEVEREILPRALNLHHAGYMGHMDSVAATVTIWADALISALNNNMLSHELAPIFTDLEAQLMTWFGQRFGLGANAFGTLTAGGTLANMTALLLARNHHDPRSKHQGITRPMAAFVSDAAHTSFAKAMNVLGLGQEHLWRVPTNQRGEIIPEALETAIHQAKALGQMPFFVAAIAGTTVTGAVDDISAVAGIAKAHDCWFHVDAAYGGAGIFAPQLASLFTGCDQADSITFNPQKWMWVSRTCAMILVRHRDILREGIDNDLPYMADNPLNFGNLNLQGTRRTDSLKLWLALRAIGLAGYQQLVERSMLQAQQVRQWVDSAPEVELVCEPTLNIICFRGKGKFRSMDLQRQWIREGKRWVSLPLWKGERILKAVVLHPHGW
ncbi:MAG: pyridoxal-dependent decarboxylase [Pseudanabaena sp. ELA607]